MAEAPIATVTGGTGFVGCRLVARLRQDGVRVRLFVRRPVASLPEGVESVVGPLTDARAARAACDGAATLYHLAGKAHDLAEVGDSGAHADVTVTGTETVVTAAVQAGVRRIVFVSSLAVYGPGPADAPRDESAPLYPVSSYGRAKRRAEELVLAAGSGGSVQVCCLRPASVYGPGAKGNLPRMIAMIRRGLFPPLPQTGNRRSMVHVDDLVAALLLAATAPAAAGRCYNVTDDRAYGARELYEAIARAVGRRAWHWSVPVPLFRALAGVGDALGQVRGRRAPFDSIAFDVLFGSAWFSAERIGRELGFRPVYSLEDALPAMAAEAAPPWLR
jgi:nucleoside-diphosphate-sugar epimerase